MGIEMTISVQKGAAFIIRCSGCGEQHTVKGADLNRLKRHIEALPFVKEAKEGSQ